MEEMKTVFVLNLLQYVLDIKRKSKNEKKADDSYVPRRIRENSQTKDYVVKDSVLWQEQLRRA